MAQNPSKIPGGSVPDPLTNIKRKGNKEKESRDIDFPQAPTTVVDEPNALNEPVAVRDADAPGKIVPGPPAQNTEASIVGSL